MIAAEKPARATIVAGPAVSQSRRNVWPIMSGVLLVLMLSSLDQTIVGTAMPRVIAQLNGFNRYTWVATTYLLTSTVTVPIYGKLSDLLGRKLVFLCGVTLFLLGSALCGAAQTMTQLILFRGLQGIGAGALIPVAIAVVGDLFPPRERGKWQGVTSSVWAFAALIGPTLGGWITDTFSWRWIFYVNLPIGLVALAILAVVMPPLRRDHARVRIDVIGAILLVTGVVPLLLALTLGGNVYAWNAAPVVALLVGTGVALTLFTAYELRYPEPILEPRLFANRTFTVSVLVTALVGAGMFGSIIFVPLFIQGIAGASATNSGAVLTPLMLMAIVGSIASGQLMSRWGRYRYIALGGVVMMMAGMALLLRLNVHTRAGETLPALLVLGAGLGFGLALYNIVVQNAFPRSRLGQVSSALTFFRSIGGAAGIALMGAFMTSHYAAALRSALPAAITTRLTPARLHALDNPQLLLQPGAKQLIARGFARLGPQGVRLFAALLSAIKSALAGALHQVFIIGLAITALAFVIVLFLPELPLRGPDEAVDEALMPEPALL